MTYSSLTCDADMSLYRLLSLKSETSFTNRLSLNQQWDQNMDKLLYQMKKNVL